MVCVFYNIYFTLKGLNSEAEKTIDSKKKKKKISNKEEKINSYATMDYYYFNN